MIYNGCEPEKTVPHVSPRGNLWKHARPYTGPVVIVWQHCDGVRPVELTDDDEEILVHYRGESKEHCFTGRVGSRVWHFIDGYARVSFWTPPEDMQ